MKKQTLFTLLAFVFLLTSCATMQNKSTSMTNYYSQAPDLSKVTYEGGDGKTLETSVIIKNAGNERNGIAAEYDYIAKKHGKKFTNWKPAGQMSQSKNGKAFDIINIITLPENETITYNFDITDFYGKF
ncbi:MAG: hypothetical protein PHS84_09120 [Paludibacter sp.]|jgi:hypothetical protein|nr:hypothetical protein [Paludibacter sp.]